jgi:hypothetical protein
MSLIKDVHGGSMAWPPETVKAQGETIIKSQLFPQR